MTPERWQHIDNLLQQVLNQPPEMRDAFLDKMCAGDQGSREEVESLLSFRDLANSFLEEPAFEYADLLFEPAEPLIGRTLGFYTIEAQLGSGGMGEVYLARDNKLDRKVAVKVLPLELEVAERARRLIREAKAAAKLDHPNICSIHEVAEDAGLGFIVMQYVEGETLASKIQDQTLELSESIELMRQVADALAAAHSHGIIHRDIKPQNIMITQRGQAKVLDFGLAKMVGLADVAASEAEPQSLFSAPGVIAGTAPYMSPEQATGAPVDTRSDLFSLGVVLYECLVGSRPFTGDSPLDICEKVAHVDPPAPSLVNPKIPREIDEIVLKALAKDPTLRYQSAGDLVEDLSRVQTGSSETNKANLGTVVQSSRSRARRRSLILAPVALAGLAVIAAIIFPEWRTRPLPSPSPEAQWFYDQGMRALRAGVSFTAADNFKKAIRLDDKFAFAHARLAEAYSEMDSTEAHIEWVTVNALVPNRSTLPRLDRLALDALNKILDRDFNGAAARYSEIVEIAAESDKSHAWFDLGRAYESGGSRQKAIDCYGKAIESDPSNAAALLRAGILYGEKNSREAIGFFEKAEEIYRSERYDEGLTEVLYQKGVLYKTQTHASRPDLLGNAKAALEQALNKAEAAGNKYQQVRAMLALGHVIQQSTPDDKSVLAYAIAARRLMAGEGMQALPTRALIDIGNGFRDLGEYQDAEIHLKHALDLAGRAKLASKEALVLMLLGTLFMQQHDPDNALPYLEKALEMCTELGIEQGQSFTRMLLADAKELKGDYEFALQEYRVLLQLAESKGDKSDQLSIAGLRQAIGFLFAHQGSFPEALRQFEAALEIYRTTGNELNATDNLMNIADMLSRLGYYERARLMLSQASEGLDRLTSDRKHQRAKLVRLSAQMALGQQRFSEALIEANRAVKLNTETRTGHKVETQALLGLALSLSGQLRTGMSSCEAAVKETEIEKTAEWMRLDAVLALAEAQLLSNDYQGALASALGVLGSIDQERQPERAWRAFVIASGSESRLGHNSNAREHASRAESLLSSLTNEWGVDNFNSYARRPDIRASRRNLNTLLALSQ